MTSLPERSKSTWCVVCQDFHEPPVAIAINDGCSVQAYVRAAHANADEYERETRP